MGASQSSGRDQSQAGSTPTRTCYYELLGIEREATSTEIKKAYRKRALELHPDRNYGNVESATERFAEVQSAYEVLSDPQERAWYDSHRESILRGVDVDDSEQPPEFNNIRLTSTEDILSLIRRFNNAVPFTDEPTGFFGIVSETFAHLADEEMAAGEYDAGNEPSYPLFGDSTDDYDSVVKKFYAGWLGFATRKTFAWKDKYRMSDAPDRRVRRLMEKENKKLRDDAIKDFNDTVRFLVTFVRKRDPRYLPNAQTASERQASMRSAAAAQAARSRAENQRKVDQEVVPDWVRSRDADGSEIDGHFLESDEESEVEHIECVVCDKLFKSDKSFHAHEKSKKHLKAIQQLQHQMRKENAQLDTGTPVPRSESHDEPPRPRESLPEVLDTRSDVGDGRQDSTAQLSSLETGPDCPAGVDEGLSSRTESSEDDEYAPRLVVEKRIFPVEAARQAIPGPEEKTELDSLPELDTLSLDRHEYGLQDELTPKKIGKAKAKRAKKAARDASTENENVGSCSRPQTARR